MLFSEWNVFRFVDREFIVEKMSKHSANRASREVSDAKIALPASNQELASHIGTVRELVSRNLSRLQVEGDT